MKSSTTYLNWVRRLVILGAVVGIGVFASTAGAVGRPPDVADVASRLLVGSPDVFERYAAAHPYGAGVSLFDVSRPPDVIDVASQLSTSTPDVFERYAAEHPYGAGTPDVFERYAAAHPYGNGLTLNPTAAVSRPPDVQDTAAALNARSSSTLIPRPPDVGDTAQALQTVQAPPASRRDSIGTTGASESAPGWALRSSSESLS